MYRQLIWKNNFFMHTSLSYGLIYHLQKPNTSDISSWAYSLIHQFLLLQKEVTWYQPPTPQKETNTCTHSCKVKNKKKQRTQNIKSCHIFLMLSDMSTRFIRSPSHLCFWNEVIYGCFCKLVCSSILFEAGSKHCWTQFLKWEFISWNSRDFCLIVDFMGL